MCKTPNLKKNIEGFLTVSLIVRGKISKEMFKFEKYWKIAQFSPQKSKIGHFSLIQNLPIFTSKRFFTGNGKTYIGKNHTGSKKFMGNDIS